MKRVLFGWIVPSCIFVTISLIAIMGIISFLDVIGLVKLDVMSTFQKTISVLSIFSLLPLATLLQTSEAYSKGITRQQHILNLIGK